MKKLVLASGNPGKLREFRQMLAPLGFEVVPQAELGISEADEPHATFVENALAKARHAQPPSGLPAFADDSGICVAALGGAPGVQSARYAGPPPVGSAGGREDQDARNNAKLLAALAGERRPPGALLLRDRAGAPRRRSRAADRRRPLARRSDRGAARHRTASATIPISCCPSWAVPPPSLRRTRRTRSATADSAIAQLAFAIARNGKTRNE